MIGSYYVDQSWLARTWQTNLRVYNIVGGSSGVVMDNVPVGTIAWEAHRMRITFDRPDPPPGKTHGIPVVVDQQYDVPTLPGYNAALFKGSRLYLYAWETGYGAAVFEVIRPSTEQPVADPWNYTFGFSVQVAWVWS